MQRYSALEKDRLAPNNKYNYTDNADVRYYYCNNEFQLFTPIHATLKSRASETMPEGSY